MLSNKLNIVASLANLITTTSFVFTTDFLFGIYCDSEERPGSLGNRETERVWRATKDCNWTPKQRCGIHCISVTFGQSQNEKTNR